MSVFKFVNVSAQRCLAVQHQFQFDVKQVSYTDVNEREKARLVLISPRNTIVFMWTKKRKRIASSFFLALTTSVFMWKNFLILIYRTNLMCTKRRKTYMIVIFITNPLESHIDMLFRYHGLLVLHFSAHQQDKQARTVPSRKEICGANLLMSAPMFAYLRFVPDRRK